MRTSSFGAIILAAGRGSRLGELGKTIPKGLVDVAGEALVVRSVEMLKRNGASKVVLVTGHLEEKYNELFCHDDLVELVSNERFAETGSLESLRLGLLHASQADPILILDSDIIFEEFALCCLLDMATSGILTSGVTKAGDEVWVVSDGYQVREISKTPRQFGKELTEFVGISRLQSPWPEQIIQLCEREPESHLMEYEAAFNLLASELPLSVCLSQELVWSEIDTPGQLEVAIQLFGEPK